MEAPEHKRKLKYDREYLVDKVVMMRIKGKSTLNLLEFLMEEVGMCRKLAYDILKDAQAIIVKRMNKDIDVALAESIERLEQLYDEGDKKLRLDALKELNKLRGLYASEKIDITTAGESINKIEISIIKRNEDT